MRVNWSDEINPGLSGRALGPGHPNPGLSGRAFPIPEKINFFPEKIKFFRFSFFDAFWTGLGANSCGKKPSGQIRQRGSAGGSD